MDCQPFEPKLAGGRRSLIFSCYTNLIPSDVLGVIPGAMTGTGLKFWVSVVNAVRVYGYLRQLGPGVHRVPYNFFCPGSNTLYNAICFSVLRIGIIGSSKHGRVCSLTCHMPSVGDGVTHNVCSDLVCPNLQPAPYKPKLTQIYIELLKVLILTHPFQYLTPYLGVRIYLPTVTHCPLYDDL